MPLARVLLPSLVLLLASCAAPASDEAPSAASSTPAAGQSAVKDTESQPDVVKVAVGSPDHSTLVAALQAASLVDALSNAGPFTVFAPTNAAFDKLPAGTVDNLLKPENKSQLKTILQHHVTTSALSIDFFQDGQSYSMVDGTRETFTMKDGQAYMGAGKIVASVRASNGWVHVVDAVLVPVAPK
ncbi:MAG: fasciclin domain-containing protein [Gemmatimonadaceae bacterium]